MSKTLVNVLAWAFVCICASSALAAVPNANGRYLIEYAPGFDTAKMHGLSAQPVGLRIDAIRASAKNVSALRKDSHVLRVEPDQQISVQSWNVERVGAPAVWNTTGGEGVRVAVLDTGALNASGGYNVLVNSSNYADTDGHGTAVLGVVRDVAPNASVYAVKIMNSSTGRLSDALAGLQWAVDHNMSIVTMSFGFADYSPIFRDAVEAAARDGVLLVAAAGNSGAPDLEYPAGYSSVVGVGATDQSDLLAHFSDHGLETEFVAPGVNVSTDGLSGPVVVNGTSVAAPHVAGVAALLLAENTSLNASGVRSLLRQKAVDLGSSGLDTTYGYGLVQANGTSHSTASFGYAYDVYNVSGYGTSNQTETYWLSGNGSIDDVNLTNGTYVVVRTRGNYSDNRTLIVDNDGVIHILSPYVVFTDDYSSSGTTSDGVVWQNSYSLGGTLTNPNSGHIGECWYFDYVAGQSSTYDYCGFTSTASKNLCSSYCNNAATCDSTSSGAYTQFFTGVGPGEYTTKVFSLDDVSGSCNIYDIGSGTYYSIDQKSTACNSGNYVVRGRYASGSYVTLNAYSCGSNMTCDSNYAGATCTTASCTLSSPCRTVQGGSCSSDSDCLTNLTCQSGTCEPANWTDLAIVNIIPIQVIPNVPMVEGKSGYVLVGVRNQGNYSANGYVRAWFNGTELSLAPSPSDRPFSFSNTNPRQIDPGAKEWFAFTFVPEISGTNLTINASVEIQ